MINRLLFLIILLLSATSVLSADRWRLITTENVAYESIYLIALETDSLKIMHDGQFSYLAVDKISWIRKAGNDDKPVFAVIGCLGGCVLGAMLGLSETAGSDSYSASGKSISKIMITTASGTAAGYFLGKAGDAIINLNQGHHLSTMSPEERREHLTALIEVDTF